MSPTSAPRNQSSSLRRALAVLGHVRDRAPAGRGLTLTRLAEDLDLSKSTVLRLITPLVEADLIRRDPETGAFRLGPATLALGQAYLSSLDLRTVAKEPLRLLAKATGETCHLVVHDPPDVVYIDKVENERTVRMGSRIGSRVPAYRTAVGKAMLAWLGEEDLQVVFAAGMPAITEHTITEPDRFRAELERVRRRGYAIDDRENEPEVRCLGAAVFDHTGSVAGALSVSGLTSRITPARAREIAPLMVRTAGEISKALGSRTESGAARGRPEGPVAR